jgi:hypothetical protein
MPLALDWSRPSPFSTRRRRWPSRSTIVTG